MANDLFLKLAKAILETIIAEINKQLYVIDEFSMIRLERVSSVLQNGAVLGTSMGGDGSGDPSQVWTGEAAQECLVEVNDILNKLRRLTGQLVKIPSNLKRGLDTMAQADRRGTAVVGELHDIFRQINP